MRGRRLWCVGRVRGLALGRRVRVRRVRRRRWPEVARHRRRRRRRLRLRGAALLAENGVLELGRRCLVRGQRGLPASPPAGVIRLDLGVLVRRGRSHTLASRRGLRVPVVVGGHRGRKQSASCPVRRLREGRVAGIRGGRAAVRVRVSPRGGPLTVDVRVVARLGTLRAPRVHT